MTNDVIIVGAGPAGACLGKLLSESGFDVLIVDKQKFPRDKVCGELVSEKAANLIEKIFGFKPDSKLYSHKSLDAAIYSRAEQLVTIPSQYPTYYVNRKSFDQTLLESAIGSGCKFHDNLKVTKFDTAQNTLYFSNGDCKKGNIIIGADGPLSSIARALFGKIKNYKANTAVGVSIKVPKENFDPRYLDKTYMERPNIYFGFVRWGYAWVFPNRDYLNVGMAGKIKYNPNFKKRFEQFLEILPIQPNGKVSIRAHPIPYGPGHIRAGKDRTILIGDAAGCIEPVTGEGIYYAVSSAVLAAEAIIQSQNTGLAVKNYRNSCNKSILRQIKQGYLARPLLYSKIMHPYALRKLNGNKFWSNGFMEILSGKTDYLNYFKKIIFGGR